MLATVRSCLLLGLRGVPLEVQVDIGNGKPGLNMTGLPAASVKESSERVRSAIINSGLDWPSSRHTTVNLAPAGLRKEGSGLDLPIAVGITLAGRGLTAPPEAAFLGELSLDGALRHVNGVLVAARSLAGLGFQELFVPATDAAEAALVPGLVVRASPDLAGVVRHLTGEEPLTPFQSPPPEASAPAAVDDLAEVAGQEAARRALEVAAGGGHHLLLSGPPGAGKTMMARCLPGVLPPLELDEALQLAQVRSVLGEIEGGRPLDFTRPFRSPHHGISQAGLIGGGGGLARPGEISRAHLGVLFLDELAEFVPSTLQALRQPLESGQVTITRAAGTVTYPCRFTLVAATNPCPCGWLGDSQASCRCTRSALHAYQRALSGPLLDRIDLRVTVGRPPLAALSAEPRGETSAAVRARVVSARSRQLDRQGCLNAALKPAQLRRHAALAPPARGALESWAALRGLTARGFHRAWRVARTVADLEGAPDLEERHVMEALGYRLQDAHAA